MPPDGADPLLWELGQLRQIAQRTLVRAEKTRNLPATASLLRAANGLLDLLARIEKAKAEEIQAKLATASLPLSEVRESLKRKIAMHAERLRQAKVVQQPPVETPTFPGNNAEQGPSSENWRNTGTDDPPEGADALLWELGQLRKVAQGALAHSTKTRNLPATASLLRAANGLLDLLARIEKAKAEELKAKQAVATLPSAAVREELDRFLDTLEARMRQAEAAAPKCPCCGQALPHGVQVKEEEPKPDGPGVH